MKRRYILYRRKRGGMFYIEDTETRKQESTGTRNRAEATTLLNARNESIRQPQLNLQIAKAYLAGTDSGVSTRTWQNALNAIIETKSGPTQDRWQRAAKQKRIGPDSPSRHYRDAGGASVRLPEGGHGQHERSSAETAQLLPFDELAAVADYSQAALAGSRIQAQDAPSPAEEHQRIIEREKNPERRSFYELCWHLGGSQTDIANLKAEDIDWPNQTIAYARQKNRQSGHDSFWPGH